MAEPIADAFADLCLFGVALDQLTIDHAVHKVRLAAAGKRIDAFLETCHG